MSTPVNDANVVTSASIRAAKRSSWRRSSPRVTSDAIAEQIQHLLEGTASPSTSSLHVKASSTILVFGGSLVGIPAYRNLIVDALKRRGHDFAGVEHIKDAADIGAFALAQRYGHL